MNRKQMRKQKKLVQKRVGKDGLKMLLDESNNELVRKEVKRQNARSLKEKLESSSFEIVMPAGNNGKLYGAVTTTVIADLLEKQGFEIEKKRIDIPGLAIKSVGNYHATIKLYESQTAEIKFVVKAQETEEKVSGKKSEKKAEVEPEKTEEKTE